MDHNGKRVPVGAHRVSWMLAKGDSTLPSVTLVRSCDTVGCVNYAHYAESEYDTMTVEEFFRAKTKLMPNGCLEWQGSKNPNGYGGMMYTWGDGRRVWSLSHRVAWHLAYGVEPTENMLHKCDNPSCCLVDHLFNGTQKDNVDDMVSKGRAAFRKQGWSSWSRGENNVRAKLTASQAEEIILRYVSGDHSMKALSESYGVSTQTIFRIVSGKGYKTAGGVPSQV